MITLLRDALREVGASERVAVLVETAVTILLIVIGAAIALRLSAAFARRAWAPRKDRVLEEARTRTLQPLAESLARYLIYFVALVMILRAAGIDTSAILASAGIVGLAVGFGAQNLIRDFISGIFLLAEGLIRVGDVVTLGEHTGTVEAISVRTTRLRKFSGELWTIPNGQIQVFGNFNRDFMRAIVEVSVAYEGDVRRAMDILQHVGQEWAGQHPEIALGPPEVHGIMRFGEFDVGVRLVIMVRPLQQWAAERELRMRVKAAFDREGIEIPFPRRVTYLRPEPGSQTAPPGASR